MMNKYHTAGASTCNKISSWWQHKPFWWSAKRQCTFLLTQKWDLNCSRNCVHYLFFPSSHCHFNTTLQPSDLDQRIPQEYHSTSHMQFIKKGEVLPYRVFWQGIVLCNFPMHSTGFCIICIFYFETSVTTAQSTCVWITKLMLQPRSMKFFWRMIFHQVLLLFVFLHNKEDNTMACKIPLPEGFWKSGTLPYWPSTVYKPLIFTANYILL